MKKKIEMKEGKTRRTFDEGFTEFILNCKVRNLRPHTIKHYEDIINHIWYKFYDYKALISDITETTIDEFIVFLRTRMNENDVTVNTNLRAMRTVLYYFMRLGYIDEFKVKLQKQDKEVIETYSKQEIELLTKKPNVKKCSFAEFRDWSVINFLLGTGCRVRTLINIKIRDLDFENQLITYTHTKNRKQQVVPMSNSLKKVLIEYLRFRKSESMDEYLFCNVFGKQVSTDSISHSLADYNRKRGVCKTGVHRWRHTFAKLWIMNGGDIFRLQKILGHSDMEVVKNYVEMFTEDLQKDFNSFNPLESLESGRNFIMKKNR